MTRLLTPTSRPADDRPAAASTPPSTDPQDSLVRRLTRLNLQVLSITMLLSFALIALASLLTARELQAQSAERSAQLLANSLAPMLVFEDREAAAAELQGFTRQADLLAVQVLDAAQRPFANWHETRAGQGQPPALVAGLHRQMHGNHVDVWLPVRLKGEVVGSLMLRASLEQVQMAVLRMVALASLLLALAIAVAWRLLRWVQGRALAPIIELSDLAEQVALSQDYSRRAQVHHADEVGRLSERFNQMLKRVEISQAELNQQLHREQLVGQQFEQLAHQDSLTQLPNRLFFQSALQTQVAASCRDGTLMALMFIDLDNFKTVNDRHGHDAGDAVLREVAARMSRVLRSGDLLCRLGGDEFGLILPALPDEQAAEQSALRLIAAIREPMLLMGHVMPVGATVGLAFCPGDARDPAQLLSAADVAMYAAKRAGKNTFRRVVHESAD